MSTSTDQKPEASRWQWFWFWVGVALAAAFLFGAGYFLGKSDTPVPIIIEKNGSE